MAVGEVQVNAFATAPMKIKEEPAHYDVAAPVKCEMKTMHCTGAATLKIKMEREDFYYGSNVNVKAEECGTCDDAVVTKPQKRISGPSSKPVKHSCFQSLQQGHRRRLMLLVGKLARKHNWHAASGVLSVLMKGAPHGCPAMEDRKKFLVAMELFSRFPDAHNYLMKIKQTYEIWMSKLAWTRKCSKKKHLLQLELALFCLTQGSITEAQHTIKFLVQDRESASEPNVHLTYGLTCYQLWYSGLPKDMQLRNFDVFMQLETSGLSSNDDFNLDIGSIENSDDHNAIDIKDVEFSSHSDGSVGNVVKVMMDCNVDAQKKKSRHVFHAHEFYMNGSAGTSETRIASVNLVNLRHNSIFFAHGLESSFLPILLKQSTGDIEQSIQSHRRLVNEYYLDAVKHLRVALYSNPPLLSALHPLIQLLLLGDQVEEALKELEKFCQNSNTALAFRFRARLLERFCSNQYVELSNCYENVLKKDPTCSTSLQRLIRMHRNGNYGTIQLLEMIALHLDATDGKCSTWEEFASCLLRLQTALQSELEEDRLSTNKPEVYKYTYLTSNISSHTTSKCFLKGEARSSWIIRCNWWSKRHFNKSIYQSEMQSGDWQLSTYKAACACHLYGPRFGYVTNVLSSLRTEGDNKCLSFLWRHLGNSLKMLEALSGDSHYIAMSASRQRNSRSRRNFIKKNIASQKTSSDNKK